MTNGIEITAIEQPKKTRKTTKTAMKEIGPFKSKQPRAKASAKANEGVSQVKKTVEIKEEAKDLANDVSEKLKAELEQVIADNVEQATVDSKLNKALRNAAIVCGIIFVAVAAWNVFG